jgi:hypothetical protein
VQGQTNSASKPQKTQNTIDVYKNFTVVFKNTNGVYRNTNAVLTFYCVNNMPRSIKKNVSFS